MKFVMRFAALTLCLAAFSGTASAQLYNFPPEIDRIGRTLSFEPGRVAIIGDHLSLVNRVTVDGVPTAILRQNSTRITIQPEVSTPGFHVVEVRNAFGTAAGMLELMPTVSGGRTGNLMDVRIANGSPGTCTLFYSTDFLAEPDSLPDVEFMRLLDLDSVLSGGIFTATIFTDQPVSVSKFKIPKDIAVTGRSFYFQALCEQGFSADGRTTMSFTNVSSIRSQPGNGHSD